MELEVTDGALIVRPSKAVRAGWAEASKDLAESGGDQPLLDEAGGNDWDDANWRW